MFDAKSLEACRRKDNPIEAVLLHPRKPRGDVPTLRDDLDVEPTADRPEDILELPAGDRPPLEELLEVQLPVAERGIVERRLAGAGTEQDDEEKGGGLQQAGHGIPYTRRARLRMNFTRHPYETHTRAI